MALWRAGAKDVFSRNARAANLIVLGRQGQGDDTDWRFGVRPEEVLMELGRPILVGCLPEMSIVSLGG